MADLQALEQAVAEQGAKVRDLKAAGASKEDIQAAVKELLARKEAFTAAGGQVAAPSTDKDKKKKKKKKDASSSAESKDNPRAEQKQAEQKQVDKVAKVDVKATKAKRAPSSSQPLLLFHASASHSPVDALLTVLAEAAGLKLLWKQSAAPSPHPNVHPQTAGGTAALLKSQRSEDIPTVLSHSRSIVHSILSSNYEVFGVQSVGESLILDGLLDDVCEVLSLYTSSDEGDIAKTCACLQRVSEVASLQDFEAAKVAVSLTVELLQSDKAASKRVNLKDYKSLMLWYGKHGAKGVLKQALDALKVKDAKELVIPSTTSVLDREVASTSAEVKGDASASSGAKKDKKKKKKGEEAEVTEPFDKAWTPTVPPGHTLYTWDAQIAGKLEARARHPPLTPVKGQRNILITSALPYVNNVPHLGNIIGCVLSADVYARFCRIRGHNTLYVSGTDEYGTATENKAIEEKTTPQAVCDKYHAIHKSIYDWFDLDFDHFGRTTTKQQEEIVQDIFRKNDQNGNIVEKEMDQLWCNRCQRFLADRFVEGTCHHPKCGYEDARGDQCDSCGKLIDAPKLIKPRCKFCGDTPVVKQSTHLFLDLKHMTPVLEKWKNTASVKGRWSENSIRETDSWLSKGLEPRAITRDLKWGIKIPEEKKGYEDKVFYVWFDAPIGYLSITANYTREWEKWWKNPDDVELVQFMGKDNIPFHTVMFPSSLLGANDNYTLLHHVSTTEYLNYEGGKFSKSRGTGVFGDGAMESGIPSEVWRYYLLVNRPEQSDSQFQWKDFQAKNNNELLNNVGNFINRALSFCTKYFDGRVPSAELDTSNIVLPAEELKTILSGFLSFQETVNGILKVYVDSLERVQLKDGLLQAMRLSAECNKFVQDTEPWELAKKDKSVCAFVVGWCIDAAALLATVFLPYMPGFSRKVCSQLNWNVSYLNLAGDDVCWRRTLPAGHKIGRPVPIFNRIEDRKVEELQNRFKGKEVKTLSFKTRLVAARVLSATPIASSDKLFALQLKTAPAADAENVQVVSGLREHYTADELKGKTVIVLMNAKKVTIQGKESNGMVLTAKSGNKFRLLTVDAPPGTPILPSVPKDDSEVVVDTKPGKNLNAKTAVQTLKMLTNKKGEVLIDGYKLTAKGDATGALVLPDAPVPENSEIC